MRVENLFESLLLEHNVVNRDRIAEYVERFADMVEHENAKQWFRKTLTAHLEKDENVNVPMTDDNRPRQAPAWLDAAIERGDDLRMFRAPHELDGTFAHLADYFNHLEKSDPRILSDLQRTLKVTVPAAIQKSEDWIKSEEAKASKTAVTGVEVLVREGPYSWVKPLTKDALHRDGKIIQNCIGQGHYDSEWEAGSTVILFLHDGQGQPHVAMRYDASSKLVGEIKGKQNRAPSGRYIELTKRFLNSMSDTFEYSSTAMTDCQQMGLKYDPTSNKFNTMTEDGEVIYKFHDGTRVVRVQAEVKKEYNHRGYGYGGYGAQTATIIEDGVDYWFNSPRNGDFLRLNHRSDGKINLITDPSMEDRPYVQEFLNTFFANGAPQPSTGSYGDASNKLPKLNLFYNGLNKKYGTAPEVGEKLAESGSLTAYRWGSLNGRVTPMIKVFNGEESLCHIDFGESEDTLNSINGYTNKWKEKEYRAPICKLLNKLALVPVYDRGRTNIDEIDLYYDEERKLYGTLPQVGHKVWENGEAKLYRWRMSDVTTYSFAAPRGANPKVFFELSSETSYVSNPNETPGDFVSRTLTAALNECSEFAELKDSDYNFNTYDVYYGKEKWGSMDETGKVFHEFDSGTMFRLVKKGEDRNVYVLYDKNGVKRVGLEFRGNKPVSVLKYDGDKMAAGHFLQWLLNSLKVPGMDTVDATIERNSEVKGTLWHHGLFFDNRSMKWKLVQEGKVLHKGPDYQAINFRNRVFIVNNHQGIIGYFKKAADYNATKIENEKIFEPFTRADFFHCISDLHKHTEFKMPRPSSEWETEYHRKAGYHHIGDQFRKIEDDYPTQEIMEVDGATWFRKAVDLELVYYEKGAGVHGERYSLIRDDTTTMRATFDEEGTLYGVRYLRKNKWNDSKNWNSDLKEMTRPERKALLSLMQKLGKKLTPSQSQDLGVYRSGGKFKLCSQNPAIKSFMDGEIRFKDGHVLRRDKYSKEKWLLGVETDEDDYYNRDKKLLTPYISVELDDEGISKVLYMDKKVKRNPKEYMPHLHKLMQIFNTLAGHDE